MDQDKPNKGEEASAMVGTGIRIFADRITIALFLGILGLPLLGVLVGNRFNPINEMRTLAPFPQLAFRRDLETFPAHFEEYWNDHFGFRGSLIYGLRVARAQLFHAAAFGHVLVGKASWLFFTPLTPGTDVEAIRPFSEAELDHWQQVLEHRRDWLQQRGCRYLLFIAPDKQTIYPEMMARRYRPRRYTSRLDQLINRLRERGSDIEIVDIRQAMLDTKERERLYHVTDSHWNDCGAYIGYSHLAAALAKWFPAVRPMPRSAFQMEGENWTEGDLARMLSLDDFKHEQWLHLRPLTPRRVHAPQEGVDTPAGIELPNPPFADECDRATLPRAVMFHDSFLNALRPFLSEHFRRIAYVRHDDLLPEFIEREHPEVVIQEWVERKLTFVTPHDFEE